MEKIYPEWSLVGFADDELTAQQLQNIIRTFDVKHVVETGIFEGKSTNRFRLMGTNVIGVEISPEYIANSAALIEREGGNVETVKRFWEISEELLFDKKRVKLMLGNSPDVIGMIAPMLAKRGLALYFLDAHWGDYWPIKDEIKALRELDNVIIVADDFKVPGKDWGYVSYKGHDLDWPYIQESVKGLGKKYRYFYSREISSRSALHGKIYIFVGDIAERIAEFDGEQGFDHAL